MELKSNKIPKRRIKYKQSDERPFECNFPDCMYTAKTPSELIAHKAAHSDVRPFACPKCKFRAKPEYTLNRHVAGVHCEFKLFACSKCDYKARTSASLESHILRQHSTRKDLNCSHPDCTKAFKTSYDLKNHVSNRHDERKLQCDRLDCGKKFANASALNHHKRRVHTNKVHACPKSSCSYRTCIATNLRTHMMAHDTRNSRIACSIKGCDYKGKNIRAVEVHRRLHEVLLPCPVSGCCQYLVTKKGLKDHAKLHNPSGRPFRCPMCFKHYKTKDQLVGHCIVHTNEKPFKCGHCEYASSARSAVKTHISSVHPNVKFPFVGLPLDERECLCCKMTLPVAHFLAHSMGHAVPVVMITRLQTRRLYEADQIPDV